MNTLENEQIIINFILIEFQNLLKVIFKSSIASDVNKNGMAPKCAVVQYHDKFDPKVFRRTGNVISVWKVYIDKIEIERIDELNFESSREPINGRYYNEAKFQFAINLNQSEVLFEWSVGPKYGRGEIFTIDLSDKKNPMISNKISLWVS